MHYFDDRGEPTTRILLAIRHIQSMDTHERTTLMKIVPCPGVAPGDDQEGVARLSRWLKSIAEFASEHLLDYETKGDVLIATRNRVPVIGFLPIRDAQEAEAGYSPAP